MFGLDTLTILKLVFLGIVILIAFLQVLYKAFVRPLQSAEERRRQQGGGKDPIQEVRDFLAELRGEKVSRAPSSPERKREGEWEVVWQALDEEPEKPSSPPARNRGEEKGEESVSPSKEAIEAPKRPALPSVREAGEDPGRHVHEYLENLANQVVQDIPELPTAPPISQQAETNIEKRFASKQGRRAQVRMDRRTPLQLPFGVTLRDALLANVVLGPPRCRQRGPRPKR